MAEKKHQTPMQFQAGSERRLKEFSSNDNTRETATETENTSSALPNAFGLLSSTKEEPDEVFTALEDGPSHKITEIPLKRTEPSTNSGSSAVRDTTASAGSDASSSLSRRDKRVAERSRVWKRDAVGERPGPWRGPSLRNEREAEGVRGQTRYHDARKGSDWMNRKRTDGRKLDWSRAKK